MRLQSLLFLIVAACVGCAIPGPQVAPATAAPQYVPIQNRAEAFAAAKRELLASLQHFAAGECNNFGHGAPFQTLDPPRDIVVKKNSFSFTEGGTTYRTESRTGQRVNFTTRREFFYRDAASAERKAWGAKCHYVTLRGTPIAELKPESYANGIWFEKREDADAFLNAVRELARVTVRDPDEDRRFGNLAYDWRAANPKPPLSESANRHRILAEGAVRDKDFDTAIEHFEAALETDPTWSSGNYNLALLYGQTGEYAEAIRYMNRFLALEPNSREAPAARERLIVWEDRVNRAP